MEFAEKTDKKDLIEEEMTSYFPDSGRQSQSSQRELCVPQMRVEVLSSERVGGQSTSSDILDNDVAKNDKLSQLRQLLEKNLKPSVTTSAAEGSEEDSNKDAVVLPGRRNLRSTEQFSSRIIEGQKIEGMYGFFISLFLV